MADYKKRAIDLLNWIDTDEGNRAIAAFPQGGPTVVSSAQVYATLALVEQQRLANILTIQSNPGVRITDELREGLGL